MELRNQLEKIALNIRIGIVNSIAAKGGGHIGGSLDLAELLAVLYEKFMRVDAVNPDKEDRDYLICSKGHAGPALYTILALKKFFPYERLETLNQDNGLLPGHCDRNKVPGIDATTGSLGQGLSIAAGVALGCKIKETDQRIFCIIGDGESAEGQVWEAAQFSAHHKLGNLIAFLDLNKMQIDGSTNEVMSLGNPVDKFSAFGWNSVMIDGADVVEIYETVKQAVSQKNGKPTMIVLDTVKGAGIPIVANMENNHCIAFPPHIADEAKAYLLAKEKELENEV